MGVAKRHRDAVFRRSNGFCIYCGGQALATTIDHMPPRSMFDRKDRPIGLEFAACEPCNRGAGRADLVAALVGRAYPDAVGSEAELEIQHYLRGAANNVPGLLEEMYIPPMRQDYEFNRRGISHQAGGFLRIDGPIALSHLEMFGARLAMAMHFDVTEAVMPKEGGVSIRVYSNLELFNGTVPKEIFEILPGPKSLAQGRKTVESQFRYGVRAVEGAQMTMSFASFRLSFAILAFASNNFEHFDADKLPDQARIYRPGQLRIDLP